MTPARTWLTSWVALLAGAVLALVFAKDSGEHADAATAMGWALLAALGVSLLLAVWGRRVVALLELALAVGLGLLVLFGEGDRKLLLGVALAIVGAVLQLLTAHRWPTRADRFQRQGSAGQHPTSDLDVWKALDAGLDPTSDDFDGSLAGRETSPNKTQPRPVVGADQEDQQ